MPKISVQVAEVLFFYKQNPVVTYHPWCLPPDQFVCRLFLVSKRIGEVDLLITSVISDRSEHLTLICRTPVCLAWLLIVAGPVFHEGFLLPIPLKFMVISLRYNFSSVDIQCCFHRQLAVFGQRAITSSPRNIILFVSFHLQAFVSAFEDVRNLLYDLLTYSWLFFCLWFFFLCKVHKSLWSVKYLKGTLL